jgi:hypothetical protein
LVANDRTCLRSKDTVVRTAWEKASFCLKSQITIEVAGGAYDRARVDWLILHVEDFAVDRMKIAIPPIEVEP